MSPAPRPDAIEQVEALAWGDTFAAAPPLPASALELEGRLVGGAFAMAAPVLDSFLFNRVVGLGMHRPASDTALDAMVAHYAGRSIAFQVNLCPHALPDDLPQRLAARGLRALYPQRKWVRGVHAPVAPRASTLRLERVRPRYARAFATLAAEAFGGALLPARDWLAACVGRSGWTHYVTYDGITVAGCGALFAHGEGAWLGWDATREGWRGRGSQALLLAARVRDAAAAGCRWISCESGPDGEAAGLDAPIDATHQRNLRRAGFEVAYERMAWVRV